MTYAEIAAEIKRSHLMAGLLKCQRQGCKRTRTILAAKSIPGPPRLSGCGLDQRQPQLLS